MFEIRRREGPALVAFNLVDELTYRIRSNMGPSIFANMMKAGFMAARLVPVADAWMLSGRQRLYGKSDRRAILQVAAELEAFTERTVTERGRLRAAILEARETGYSLVDQELVTGVRALAVPIRDREGTAQAGLNVAVADTRRDVGDLLETHLPVLRRAAESVGTALASIVD